MVPSETILPLLTTYAREFYQLCDMVTAPSRHARQSMLDEGYTVPIEVLSNGVDIPLEVVRSPEKVPIVLSVTRVDPDKNIDLLLEVARRFSQDARFVIVGGGSLLKQYQEQIAGDQELKHVRFIGQVQAGSAALDRWYQRATLFFVPSLVETQGLALLEAMARAVPALAVRAGALPELVLSKKTGWVADPSADEIEPLLRAALADSSALAAYGTAARKMAEHEHGRPRVIARLEELYASLLKAK
jgi:glycosyltransferase involved in cell wall biosynthesis